MNTNIDIKSQLSDQISKQNLYYETFKLFMTMAGISLVCTYMKMLVYA